jgi:hypothetical protein
MVDSSDTVNKKIESALFSVVRGCHRNPPLGCVSVPLHRERTFVHERIRRAQSILAG